MCTSNFVMLNHFATLNVWSLGFLVICGFSHHLGLMGWVCTLVRMVSIGGSPHAGSSPPSMEFNEGVQSVAPKKRQRNNYYLT